MTLPALKARKAPRKWSPPLTKASSARMVTPVGRCMATPWLPKASGARRAAAVPPGQERQEHQDAADAGADEGHRAADDLEAELPQAVAGQIAHGGADHHADYPDQDPNSCPHSSLSSLIAKTLVRGVLTSCSQAAQRTRRVLRSPMLRRYIRGSVHPRGHGSSPGQGYSRGTVRP